MTAVHVLPEPFYIDPLSKRSRIKSILIASCFLFATVPFPHLYSNVFSITCFGLRGVRMVGYRYDDIPGVYRRWAPFWCLSWGVRMVGSLAAPFLGCTDGGLSL